MTNKKRKTKSAMSTKREMVMAFEKGSPPTMVTGHNSHMMNIKSYISVYTWLMTTKLSKVMVYGTGPPCTK